MASDDFILQILIEKLLNTKDEIQKHLPKYMKESDLTLKQINEIYEVIFRCNDCGTWKSKDQESVDKEEFCIECSNDTIIETIKEYYNDEF